MLLLLDNYDSFTFNLAHYLDELPGAEVVVRRNDEISLEEAGGYDRIVLSPGPGLPEQAGILLPLIKKYAETKPMLGVCLGHQAMVLAFGGQLRPLDQVMHGVKRKVIPADAVHPLFQGVTAPFDAGRYHSWVPDEKSFPAELEVLARGEDQSILMLKHRRFPLYGMQFHPESVMTPCGRQLLANWFALTGEKHVSLP
ncbi:MAG: aminodeoxychorismate/anthranilate synthase component II [Bacteroidia bacterium]|nr:aminodeoxychorismate/anthranilate synthase component II [Bacteroidia bacterium]